MLWLFRKCCHFHGRFRTDLRNFTPMLPCLIAAVLSSGCHGGSTVDFHGEVLLDGRPVPAEIQFEQLSHEGSRVGKAAITYADQNGRFSQSIERATGGSGEVFCLLSVRIPETYARGSSTSHDEPLTGAKVVRLKRIIADGDRLHLVLTR